MEFHKFEITNQSLTNVNVLYCKIHEKLIKSDEFSTLKPLKTEMGGRKFRK